MEAGTLQATDALQGLTGYQEIGRRGLMIRETVQGEDQIGANHQQGYESFEMHAFPFRTMMKSRK
jgi:hypothetical protein